MFTPSKFPVTVQMFPTPAIGKVDQAVSMISGKGTSDKVRVKFQGSLWGAEIWQSSSRSSAPRPLLPSERVWVIGRVGLTLLVQPFQPYGNLPHGSADA